MIAEPGPEIPSLRRAPAERMAASVLPASGVIWTAAEVMHFAGVHMTLPLGGATAFLAILTWGAAGRRKDMPGSLPWWVAACGAWLTAAADLGPLAWWPAPVLTGAWLVLAVAASRAAHRHSAVTEAREWREARERWLMIRNDWGLGGSHLIGFERTDIGELYTVNIKGTGKKRSEILSSKLAEHIAQVEDLDENRVELMRFGPAGRVRISIRRADPWERPVLHPLVCDEHDIAVPEVRSILDEAMVGQNRETGDLLTVPLCDDNGARRVSVTGISGAGKGVLIDDLAEHVTACDDALMVHLNLSVKGYEDEESWGPACWLTAYGPEQKSRAGAILKIIGEVIEWRARNFKRGQYVPSPEHPAIIVFADESDAAVAVVREGLNMIATKGRSAGVGYVHVGQRNTRDYADPKARSQDNVFCTGMVRNANEDRHAGTGTGPDMATYGEGKPGVWKIERLGGGQQVGRTWIFHPKAAGHGAEVERIAQERADYQPELSHACLEYLGDAYRVLRATEVYERYDRSRNPDAYDDSEPDAADAPAGEAPQAPAPSAPQDPAAAPSAPARTAKTALAEKDPFETWLEMDVDEGTQEKLAAIHAKLGGARQILEEAEARPRPVEGDPEARAAVIAERWKQVEDSTEITPDQRATLLGLLADGTTADAAGKALGVSKWKALTYLRKLRSEGVARVDGKGRAARWRQATPAGGDSQ